MKGFIFLVQYPTEWCDLLSSIRTSQPDLSLVEKKNFNLNFIALLFFCDVRLSGFKTYIKLRSIMSGDFLNMVRCFSKYGQPKDSRSNSVSMAIFSRTRKK